MRDPHDPKGSCGQKGSEDLQTLFKAELKRRGLQTHVRANKAGCLDACEYGPTVVIYPEGVWYGQVTAHDIAEIIEEHLIKGIVVERLMIKNSKFKPDALIFPPLVK